MPDCSDVVRPASFLRPRLHQPSSAHYLTGMLGPFSSWKLTNLLCAHTSNLSNGELGFQVSYSLLLAWCEPLV